MTKLVIAGVAASAAITFTSQTPVAHADPCKDQLQAALRAGGVPAPELQRRFEQGEGMATGPQGGATGNYCNDAKRLGATIPC
jgi:hypothetical protein